MIQLTNVKTVVAHVQGVGIGIGVSIPFMEGWIVYPFAAIALVCLVSSYGMETLFQRGESS